MGLIKGGALRLLQTLFYVIAFCCAGLITGIFSYFIYELNHKNLDIATKWKAVLGMAGVACVYTMFAILLTCCLAGKIFFSMIGLVMDLACMGAFIAIAVLTKNGTKKCNSNSTNSPLGANARHPKLDCRLEKAVFIVAIIGAVFFLITALMQMLLVRHNKKEQRFGPSPDNNYTSGSAPRKFYQRQPKVVTEKDVEVANPTPAVIPPVTQTVRPSHDTAYTGSTVAAPAGNRFAKKEVEPVVPAHNAMLDDIHNGSTIYARMPEEPHGEHAPHVGWMPHNHAADREGYVNNTTTTPARNF